MTAVILDSVLETNCLIFCPENGRKLVFKSHGKLQKKPFCRVCSAQYTDLEIESIGLVLGLCLL